MHSVSKVNKEHKLSIGSRFKLFLESNSNRALTVSVCQACMTSPARGHPRRKKLPESTLVVKKNAPKYSCQINLEFATCGIFGVPGYFKFCRQTTQDNNPRLPRLMYFSCPEVMLKRKTP